MTIKRLLALAAVLEAVTGLALMIDPAVLSISALQIGAGENHPLRKI